MEGKIRLAVFGQKRLSREGGIDTILDVDNQRQSLKELAEKYTSIRRKDYLEWRIRLEHEMIKAEEK